MDDRKAAADGMATGETLASDPALAATGASGPQPSPLSATRDSDSAMKRVIAGRFELRAELGRGAFGVVYRAFDTVARDEVAIKVIDVKSSQLAERVRRELRSARRVTARRSTESSRQLHV